MSGADLALLSLSAGSVPLATDFNWPQVAIRIGESVLLSGFGGVNDRKGQLKAVFVTKNFFVTELAFFDTFGCLVSSVSASTSDMKGKTYFLI